MSDVTRILTAMENGDSAAAESLLPLVYQELRKLAAAKLSHQQAGQTLQPTALVHEAYVRMVGSGAPHGWNGRGHFFAAAAEAMRRILVEKARRKHSQKFGGGWKRQEFDAASIVSEDRSEALLALDEALTKLQDRWPEKAQLVKLRYFAGLTVQEAAQALKVSVATAERYWTFARAWLQAQLSQPDE